MRFTRNLKFVKFRIYGNLREKKESSGMIFIFDPQCHTLVTFFLNLPKWNSTNSEHLHQTAPLGAVLSGSAQFVQPVCPNIKDHNGVVRSPKDRFSPDVAHFIFEQNHDHMIKS